MIQLPTTIAVAISQRGINLRTPVSRTRGEKVKYFTATYRG